MTQPDWMTATQQATGIPDPLMIAFLEKLKRFTVQIVAKCQPDKFGYDYRESWNMEAVFGPWMSPKSGKHYVDTPPCPGGLDAPFDEMDEANCVPEHPSIVQSNER